MTEERRYLVVDDDENCLTVCQYYLRPYGEVALACNGEEALACFSMAVQEKRPFFAVLMDINMPLKGGAQTVHELRDMERRCAVPPFKLALVSSYERTLELTRFFLSDDVAVFIAKPFSQKTFLQELQQAGIIT